MQVPQAHCPVRECLGGLGRATGGSMVCGCVKACLHGLAHQAGQLPSPSALSRPPCRSPVATQPRKGHLMHFRMLFPWG